MASFFKNLTRKEDPTIYQNKDGHLKRTLRASFRVKFLKKLAIIMNLHLLNILSYKISLLSLEYLLY
jgi:hypothetical protein